MKRVWAFFSLILSLIALPGLNARSQPEIVYLRLISVATAAEAQRVEQALSSGTSFQEVARKYSTAPSAERWGYLGALAFESLQEDFKKALDGIDEGQRTPLFQSGDEWIILEWMPFEFRQEAYRLQERGLELAEQGKFREAIELYQRAIAFYPDFIHCYFSLAVAHGKLGNFKKEEELYLKAIDIEPTYHKAHYNLAVLLARQGRLDEAIHYFRSSLAIKPDQADCYISLAGIYQRKGDLAAALAAATRAVELNPLRAEAYFNLAAIYREQGRLEEAARYFETSTELNSQRPEFYMAAAVTHYDQGRFQQAIDLLEQLLRKHPGFQPARDALKQIKTGPHDNRH